MSTGLTRNQLNIVVAARQRGLVPMNESNLESYLRLTGNNLLPYYYPSSNPYQRAIQTGFEETVNETPFSSLTN